MTAFTRTDSLDLPVLAAAPEAPEAGRKKLYIGDDGALLAIDSSGLIVPQRGTLSDYQNVVVVDAGGNGDYENLTTALAALTSDDVMIYVFGHTNEPAQIDIEGRTVNLFLSPNAVVDLGANKILIKPTGGLKLYGNGTITSANTTSTIENVYNGSEFDTMLLVVDGPLLIESSTSSARVIYAKAGLMYDLRYCEIKGGAMQLDTVACPAIKHVSHVRFTGGTNYSISSMSHWNDAPVYHCIMDKTMYKVWFAAGNFTNVVAGSTGASPDGWRGTSATNFTTTNLYRAGDYGYQTTDNELQINVDGTIRAIPTIAL